MTPTTMPMIHSPSDLFSEPETALLSPRLRWCAKHQVSVKYRPLLLKAYAYRAQSKDIQEFGYGPTSEEACQMLCQMLGLPHWSFGT